MDVETYDNFSVDDLLFSVINVCGKQIIILLTLLIIAS